MTPHTVPTSVAALAEEVDEDVRPVGELLCRWFFSQGRTAEACSIAYSFGLLSNDDFEAAWASGVSPLVIAGLVSR